MTPFSMPSTLQALRRTLHAVFQCASPGVARPPASTDHLRTGRASSLLVVVGIGTLGSVAAAQEACLEGYRGATTSVSTFAAQQSLGEAEYRNYCQSDGTVNKTRFDASGTTLIGLAPVISSFSGSNDYEKTKSFCDEYKRNYSSSLNVYAYERSVALDALKSFNSCVALFAGEKITVEYSAVPKNTFNLSVALPAAKTVTLNGVNFDPKELSCRFSPGRPGAAVQALRPGQAARKLEDDFVINCTRTAYPRAGKVEYRPVELSLTLNGRQYTFWSPADGVLDYSSALQQQTLDANYQANLKALQGQLAALQTQVNTTQAQMAAMRPVIVAGMSDPNVPASVGFKGQGQLHVQYDLAYGSLATIDGEAARVAAQLCYPLRATKVMNPYAVRGGGIGVHQFVFLCAP